MGTGRLIIIMGFFVALPVNLFSAGEPGKTFPYFRVNHVVKNNGLFFASGVVVEEKERWDAMNNKIQTLFYLISANDSSWNWCKPVGITIRKGGDTLKYEAFPRNIVAFQNYLLSIIDVGENPDRMQVIHYSKDGIQWISTGIYVTSIHVIKDKVVAEHNLSLSVSEDAIHWKLFAYNNWDNSYPEYANMVPADNQTISVFSYADTTGNENFSKEEYPYITYDWNALKGYYRDSTYVLTDTSSFIAISHDGIKWNYIETPSRADSNFCLQYAHGRIFYIEISKGSYYLNSTTNFINWTRSRIETDSNDIENGFIVESACMPDTTLYVHITAYYGDEENGVHEYRLCLTSADEVFFQPCESGDAGCDELPVNSPPGSVSHSLIAINYRFKELTNGKLIGMDHQ